MTDAAINTPDYSYYTNQITQLNARLAALDKFINGVLKDLIDTQTNLNLYTQSYTDLNAKFQDQSKELEALKNPASSVDVA